MIDLRCQLDRERHLRMMLQKQNQSLHLKQDHPTFVEQMQEKIPKDNVVSSLHYLLCPRAEIT